MREAGVIESVTRGIYRLASIGPLVHPDLVAVAMRVLQGVLCLISALSYHELTTIELTSRRPPRNQGPGVAALPVSL